MKEGKVKYLNQTGQDKKRKTFCCFLQGEKNLFSKWFKMYFNITTELQATSTYEFLHTCTQYYFCKIYQVALVTPANPGKADVCNPRKRQGSMNTFLYCCLVEVIMQQPSSSCMIKTHCFHLCILTLQILSVSFSKTVASYSSALHSAKTGKINP